MTELHTAGSWKKIVPALAALGLLLALQLTGMSAASAAPTHSAATVAHTQGAQPGTTPSGTFRVFYPTLPAGGYWWVHCTANNEGNNLLRICAAYASGLLSIPMARGINSA